jgi:hypothetical protein
MIGPCKPTLERETIPGLAHGIGLVSGTCGAQVDRGPIIISGLVLVLRTVRIFFFLFFKFCNMQK